MLVDLGFGSEWFMTMWFMTMPGARENFSKTKKMDARGKVF